MMDGCSIEEPGERMDVGCSIEEPGERLVSFEKNQYDYK